MYVEKFTILLHFNYLGVGFITRNEGYSKHYYIECDASTTGAVLKNLVYEDLDCVGYNSNWDLLSTLPPALNTANDPENLRYFYHPDHLGSSSMISNISGLADQHIQYLPFGELFVSQRNSSFDSRYKFTAKELDNETNYTYFGARYYDSDLSNWLSVDPMADKYPNLSPYNYCANNPVILIDPNGMSIGWVGTKNSSGNIEWKWNSKINSQSQANIAGFQYYSDPGKIISTKDNGKVRLGENGVVHVGIIGIHSTGNPQSENIQDGHAWITISDVEGKPLQSYGLWPDSHPYFDGQDNNGSISDVRIGIELKSGLINKQKTYSYYAYLSKYDAIGLTEYIGNYSEWYYYNNCSDWATQAFKVATGYEFDNSDYFLSGTPRELSRSIIKKGNNNFKQQNYEENDGTSSSSF